MCVIGTRPEAIKMAPVVAELRRRPWARTTVVAAAQHRELLDQALAVFELAADIDLDVMRADQPLAALTGRLIEALDRQIGQARPDMVLAQGDTTTVLAAAMASFYRRVPFGHVEAGLRTGDLEAPFPEEFNRVTAGRLATLHFAPAQAQRRNLLSEGIAPERIVVSGNTVIDALLGIAGRDLARLVPPTGGRRILLLTLHRRESFGEPLARVLHAVRRIADAFDDLAILYPVHPNPAVLAAAQAILGSHPRITLMPPLRYDGFVALLKAACLVLTDSGGVQEEAPALGRPVLVLRDKTERPEVIALGTARLVGTEPDRILAEAGRLLADPAAHAAMARPAFPYGDGRAAPRIVDAIAAWLGVSEARPRVPA
jgi:UDP-N-acetylglucosamine 2-epimerase (non-hydrolysing)